jgi:hypothetical protein
MKPYCDRCGWNVARARRHCLNQLQYVVVSAAVMAVFAWAVIDMNWSVPLIVGWVLVLMALPIVKGLRRLPPPRTVPPLPSLSGIADLSPVTLDVVTPRLNIIFEGLIVVAATVAMLFLPRELDPAQRKLPLIRHELLLVTLVTMFVVYQFIAHGMELFRLVRSIWLERHLAKRALIAEVASSRATLKR